MQVEVVGLELISDFEVAAARPSNGPRIAIPAQLLVEAPERIRITIADESCLNHPERGQSDGQEY